MIPYLSEPWLHGVEEIDTCCTDICLYILMNELRLASVSEKKEKNQAIVFNKNLSECTRAAVCRPQNCSNRAVYDAAAKEAEVSLDFVRL
jgi:hypothetical protein